MTAVLVWPSRRASKYQSCENPAPTLFCGLFEGPQHGVAARDRGIERLLRGLLSAECRLDLLGPEVAHLHHVAEAQAPRILRRLLVGELLQRRLQRRLLLIEAVGFGLFIIRPGDRPLARLLVQLGLP